jgi:ribosomal subunit interface protein
MKYDIHGDKIVVTAAIKKYVEEKLSRLDKYFEKASDLKTRVIIKVKGCNQTIGNHTN